MRIIAGALRGRRLKPPKTDAIRPTTDRMRETLFSMLSHRLNHDFSQLRVLDLFAGTGALGLEALSRGAAHVTFVDKDRSAIALIKDNVASLAPNSDTLIECRDATRLDGERPPFDLVFADAPYGKGLAVKALENISHAKLLNPDAVCVLERAKSEDSAALPIGFSSIAEKSMASTALSILQPKSDKGTH